MERKLFRIRQIFMGIKRDRAGIEGSLSPPSLILSRKMKINIVRIGSRGYSKTLCIRI